MNDIPKRNRPIPPKSEKKLTKLISSFIIKENSLPEYPIYPDWLYRKLIKEISNENI